MERKSAKVFQYLTADELKKFMAEVYKNASVRDRCWITLALGHGMRVSEVCNLRLGDLDLKNGYITIRRLKGSLLTPQPLLPKSKHFHSEESLLNAWLKVRDDSSDFVFTSRKSGRLHRTTLFLIYRDIAAKIGLPEAKRHVHCLKHSTAMAMHLAGKSLSEIQTWLGHAEMSSTLIYLNRVSDEQAGKAAASAFANI
jgi:type 1 fimbriae regulatory protein FimB